MENWKSIEGYEGLYEVSDLGNIKSYHKGRLTLLKPNKTKKGYLRVTIQKGYRTGLRPFLVHVLVAKAFIPNPENKPQVNHKNGIKWDNYVDNLEWNTASENIKHAYDNGYYGDINGENNNYHKLTTEDVLLIRSLEGRIKQVVIADIFGVSGQCIKFIHKRIKWKHI